MPKEHQIIHEEPLTQVANTSAKFVRAITELSSAIVQVVKLCTFHGNLSQLSVNQLSPTDVQQYCQ